MKFICKRRKIIKKKAKFVIETKMKILKASSTRWKSLDEKSLYEEFWCQNKVIISCFMSPGYE